MTTTRPVRVASPCWRRQTCAGKCGEQIVHLDCAQSHYGEWAKRNCASQIRKSYENKLAHNRFDGERGQPWSLCRGRWHGPGQGVAHEQHFRPW